MKLVLINYGHYLAIAGLFAALAVELALFRPRVDGRVARTLARIDGLFGLSLLVALVTGLLKVFVGDKPAAYYGHNGLFHAKITLFAAILVMSIYPTRRFLAKRRAAPAEQVDYPRSIVTVLRVELVLLILIPLLAALMARGYGAGG